MTDMTTEHEQQARKKCLCEDCTVHRQVLSLLDDIATSDGSMGMEDVDNLCEARRLLAETLGEAYNEDTNRYTEVA